MEQKKKFSWQNILFIAVIILLLIPQTRTPIQVGLNKVMLLVFSPSEVAKEDQVQLAAFDYKVITLDGLQEEVPIGKGQVTFVSYWATWCPPCIAEMPSIASLYADYGDKMQFLMISNEDPEVVARFLKKKEYKLPSVSPAMETPPLLFERSIPTSYIIDKTGSIVIKEQGATDWNSDKVRVVLDNLLASD